MTPQRQPASVVRVYRGRPSGGGRFVGTAFFIEQCRALTARHVVEAEVEAGRLYLQVGWHGVAEVAVQSFVSHPGGVDAALLTIDRQWAAPVAELIRIGDVPELTLQDPLVLCGFADVQNRIDMRPATIINFDGGSRAVITEPTPSKGMSGGPAIGPDAVLRGINHARSRDGARGYVIPIAAYRDFLRDHDIDLTQPICPYPGLARFERADATRFFGRDAAIDRAASSIRKGAFTALVGASGSGKSSLLLAGVLPELENEVLFGVCRIGRDRDQDPLGAIARAVAGLMVDPNDVVALAKKTKQVQESLAAGDLDLAGLFDALFAQRGKPIRIVIDQFEELFTLAEPAHRDRFLAQISGALPAGQARAPDVGLVITLRADFYGEALRYRVLADLLQDNVVNVGPMSRDELDQAINRPARDAGVALEEGLSRRLIEDVGDRPGNLPLLQFALREMWTHMRTRRLEIADYDALGGLSAALTRRAEKAYDGLVAPGDASDEDFRQLFTRLVVATGRDVTRRVAKRADLSERAWALARGLAGEDNRLVVTGALADGTETVEIVHEELARSWPRLRDWLDRDQGLQAWLQQIRAQLDAWAQDETDSGALLRGATLRAGETWLETRAADLNESERRFLEESRRFAQEESLREQQAAEAIARAESLRLAIEADRLAAREPETALRLAWEALLWNRNELSESRFREAAGRIRATTHELLPSSRDDRGDFIGWVPEGGVWQFSSDGDGHIWDEAGQLLARIKVEQRRYAAASVDDGLVVVSPDGELRLFGWDGEQVESIALPDVPDSILTRDRDPVIAARDDGIVVICIQHRTWTVSVTSAGLTLRAAIITARAERPEAESFFSYTPYRAQIDRWSERFLVVGSDRKARCFDLDGPSIGVLTPPGRGGFQFVEFLAKDRIVGGEMGGRGHVWTPGGALINVYCEDNDGRDLFVRAVDPGGSFFATAKNLTGAPIIVRDGDGTPQATLSCGDAISIRVAGFSADGALLAVGSDDGSTRVWDWRSGVQVCALEGHVGTVSKLLFHRTDSNRLITGSHDNSVRHWLMVNAVLPVLPGQGGSISVIHRAGAFLVSADGPYHHVTIWEGMSPRRLREIFVASFPDGRLVTRSRSQVFVRDLREALQNPVAFAAPDYDFVPAISCDGRRVALLSERGGPIPAMLYNGGGGDGLPLDGNSLDPEHDDRRLVGGGFSQDGAKFAVGCRGGMIWTWTSEGMEIASWLAENYSAPDLLFSFAVDPRGAFLIGGIRDWACLWNWQGEQIARLRVRGYKTQKLAIRPDGALIVTLSDNPSGSPSAFAELWTREGDRLALLEAPSLGYYPRIEFDPQGRFLLLLDRDLRLYDSFGTLIDVLIPGRNQRIADVAIAPEGDSVAALFEDGELRFWHRDDARWTTPIQTHASGPITFSHDGRRLLAAHASGMIEQIPLAIDDLFEGSRARLTRGFDDLERRRFGLAIPPRLSL